MKKFFCLLALIAIVIAPIMAADVDATVTRPGQAYVVGGFDGGSNKITALSTGSFFTVSSVEQAQIDVHFNYRFLTAPGAGDSGNIRLDLFRGIDSTSFESNSWQSIVFAPGSTTTANATNFSLTLDGVPYLRGRFVSVSTNAHATNITFKVQPKTPATKLR